jgi:tagatose-1,6-bisphosphate aldolase non-catalytic subunit AgaZ/GatZ
VVSLAELFRSLGSIDSDAIAASGFSLKARLRVPAGIYFVCSAHPWEIRAAAEQAAEAQSPFIARGYKPVSLIIDRIRDVLRVYAAGCNHGAPL